MSFKEYILEFYGWTWEYFDNNISNPSHYYEEYNSYMDEQEENLIY